MSAYVVSGKVFFVTGGAQGIGKGIIEEVLLKQAKVFFVDVNEDVGKATQVDLEKRFDADKVGFAVCDVTDRARFEECFQLALTKFGQVDVMVNNAGIAGETKPSKVIDINLKATIYGTEIASKHMRKDEGGNGGRIINMSSLAGLVNHPIMPIYTASKSGIFAYTQSLCLNPFIDETGLEYATLHPGPVDTAFSSALGPGDILHVFSGRFKYEPTFMPVSRVVQAFVKILSLEKMNGAALQIRADSMSFVKPGFSDLGDSYPAQ